jgi:hypothetical protein
MKRLAEVFLLLTIWICPAMLHASLWHKIQPKVQKHAVVRRPHARHYTQKTPRHVVLQPTRPRYYAQKAHVNKAARRNHGKHKKIWRH